MSDIELILREIEDKHTRENFARIIRHFSSQFILGTDWKLHEVFIKTPNTNFKLEHNLDFIPTDIIQLTSTGDQNYYFRYDQFTRKNIIIDADGPVKLRFLAGSYKEKLDADTSTPTHVPITGIPGPTGPAGSGEVVRTMACAASAAVNDWVRHSLTVDNSAVVNADNTASQPTIGIITAKPTSVTCDVLFQGLYTGLALSGRGLFRLGTAGAATFAVPTTGFIQNLGISFGDGTIYINPGYHRIERTP